MLLDCQPPRYGRPLFRNDVVVVVVCVRMAIVRMFAVRVPPPLLQVNVMVSVIIPDAGPIQTLLTLVVARRWNDCYSNGVYWMIFLHFVVVVVLVDPSPLMLWTVVRSCVLIPPLGWWHTVVVVAATRRRPRRPPVMWPYHSKVM